VETSKAEAAGDAGPNAAQDDHQGQAKSGEGAKTAGGVDAAALTRTFSRHMGPIRSCLATDREAVASTRQMSILFSVDAQGRVTEATLSPASLQTTEMGRCVVGAARGIPFGPQPKPTSFRIPITMGYK
jgi:hypothetical protein